MSKLYIVTGPAGVGKSTISKGIADCENKSVLIEGDDIYHQVVGGYVSPWKDGNHLELFWNVCISTIKIYLEAGYDVVFNYIISNKEFEKLKEIFKEYEMRFIVLLVNKETIIERDNLRPEDCRMKERCLILLDNFINYNYNTDYIIYTDGMSILDTVAEVMSQERFIVKK